MQVSSKKPYVILLDCDLRNTEGAISTFGRKKIPIIAISAEDKPAAYRSRYLYKKYKSPNVSDEKEYLKFILGLKERGVIVYSSDTSAEFISKYRHELINSGYLINITEHQSFKRGFDKDKIFIECNKLGIPTIKTLKIEKLSDLNKAFDEIGAPLLLKPTRLAGGRFKLIKEKSEIEPTFIEMTELINSKEFKFQKSGLIAQEYISYNYDDLYCCESYYTTKSKPVGFLSIRKLRPNINKDGTTGSRLFAGETLQDKKLEQYSKKLLDSLEWKSFAHMDWLYSSKYNSYLLCEINPRLPGFTNFMIKNGFDMPWYYYADLTDHKIEKFKFRKALYFEAFRIPGDISNSIYSILKGHIKPLSFLYSYIKMFTFQYNVCFDVYYGNDLGLTFYKWYTFLIYLLKRPFRVFKRIKK